MGYVKNRGGSCITGARFTMRATLLHQEDNYNPYPVPDLDQYGTWTDSQDPLTGEVVRVWIPYTRPVPPGSPDGTNPTIREIPCLVRGIVDGGIRVAGTTEWFGNQDYRNIDFAKMWIPPNIKISKRDRITNVKDAQGRIMWHNEEYEPLDPNFDIDFTDPSSYNQYLKATIFNVNGVTPLFNAFNRPVEQFVLLENAASQENLAL